MLSIISLAAIVWLSVAGYSYYTSVASHRALLSKRLVVPGRVQKVLHYGHVIHKPFAMIMDVHIGVTIWTSYAW